MSAAARRRGSEASVGDAARKVLRRIDKGGHMERTRAVSAWREAAGEEVALHAVGYAMRGAELIVYTDSPVWAAELSALSEHYRSEINRLVGRELVGTIRFTVSKQASEHRERQEDRDRIEEERTAARVDPVPATAQESAQIEAMAASIHDEALREAAVRAALRALEWQKGLKARRRPQAVTDGSQDGISGG